ncbi:hypothetical protein ACHAXA_000903 [Cyclostephanos tholiformis]|uniref:Uncharacterized protein n=1 Tax=Cyclostephanos tholiformis TaxID=382380 RepID=A0ABD3RX50_9STRA
MSSSDTLGYDHSNIIVVKLSPSSTYRDGQPDNFDVYRLYHPSEIIPTMMTTTSNDDSTLRLAEDTRRLLLKLRVKAWEDAVFRSSSTAIVGNDDDDRQGGRWSDGGNRIPILHFSDLTRDGDVGTGDVKFGRIDKRKCEEGDFVVASSHQRARLNEVRTKGRNFDTERQSDVDREVLRRLLVVICMAMFQTNGALESNVASIGRVEGKSLWHII